MKTVYTDIIQRLDQDKAIEILQKMICFNTANPPGAERFLAEYLTEILEGYGINSHVDDLGDGRGNVIGRIEGSKERPDFLLNGHLDVVPPGEQAWTYEPFSGIIDSGKLYGRGASDMKGGLAALVVAAGLIAQAGIPLKGDLLITGTAGEEVDSQGAVDLLNRGYLKNVGAAVIAEPSLLKLFSAMKGAVWLEFRTVGKTAHGSMPECGQNAILMMNALLNKLTEYKFKFERHALLGEPSMNIGTVQGGVKTNVVPDSCVITVDIRTVPGQDHDQIVRDMQEILNELEHTVVGFKGSLAILNNRLPVETAPDNELIQLGIKTAKETLDLELEPCGVNYYTDASVFATALRIPVLIFGPGDEKMAHRPDEYVELDKYFKAIKFYVAFILDYLAV